MANRLKTSNDGEIKKLKEFINFAKDVVKGEDDEIIKTESFKIILNKMIEDGFSGSAKKVVSDGIPLENKSNTEKQLELAELCQISIDELNDVFQFKDDTVEIIAPIMGNDHSKRIIVSQCYLAALETCYSKEWVDSSDLAECTRSAGLKDVSNLSKQLKRLSDIFRSTGTRGHNKYRLTSGVGRQSAFKIIHKLAKGEKLEN